MRSIEAIERQRWQSQLAALECWLAEEGAAGGDDADADAEAAGSFVYAQLRRDHARLTAAVAGRTPSAVVHRVPSATGDETEERRRLACDEAAHTADNVRSFIARTSDDEAASDTAGPNTLRAARWALRLRLELLDAGPENAIGEELAALARRIVAGGPEVRRAAVTRLRAVTDVVTDAVTDALTDPELGAPRES